MTAIETVYYATVPSSIGDLLLTSDGDHLTGIHIEGPKPGRDWHKDTPTLAVAADELRAYFAGELREFTIPLRPDGTPFQQKVWSELRRIRYGETISYAELATRVGNPLAARAVGSANGKNPICVIIPCHRVIAADGTLGGFGGGLWRKEWLLKHESAQG